MLTNVIILGVTIEQNSVLYRKKLMTKSVIATTSSPKRYFFMILSLGGLIIKR